MFATVSDSKDEDVIVATAVFNKYVVVMVLLVERAASEVVSDDT